MPRRKRYRTDPKTGERRERTRRGRGWATSSGYCACGFPAKLRYGLLVRCRVCGEGHHHLGAA